MGWLVGFGILCVTVTAIVWLALDFTGRVAADGSNEAAPDPVEPEQSALDLRRERRAANAEKWREKAQEAEREAEAYLDDGKPEIHAFMFREAAEFRYAADRINAVDAPSDAAPEKITNEEERRRAHEEELDAAVARASKGGTA